MKVPRPFESLRSHRRTFISSARDLGYGLVKEVDEMRGLRNKLIQRGKVAAARDLSREDREMHCDFIDARGILRREVKYDAVSGVTQEHFARGHQLEGAAHSLKWTMTIDYAAHNVSGK